MACPADGLGRPRPLVECGDVDARSEADGESPMPNAPDRDRSGAFAPVPPAGFEPATPALGVRSTRLYELRMPGRQSRHGPLVAAVCRRWCQVWMSGWPRHDVHRPVVVPVLLEARGFPLEVYSLSRRQRAEPLHLDLGVVAPTTSRCFRGVEHAPPFLVAPLTDSRSHHAGNLTDSVCAGVSGTSAWEAWVLWPRMLG